MKVLLLAGGWSPEREVSLKGGEQIAAALKERGHSVTLCDPAKDFERLMDMAASCPRAMSISRSKSLAGSQSVTLCPRSLRAAAICSPPFRETSRSGDQPPANNSTFMERKLQLRRKDALNGFGMFPAAMDGGAGVFAFSIADKQIFIALVERYHFVVAGPLVRINDRKKQDG